MDGSMDLGGWVDEAGLQLNWESLCSGLVRKPGMVAVVSRVTRVNLLSEFTLQDVLV